MKQLNLKIASVVIALCAIATEAFAQNITSYSVENGNEVTFKIDDGSALMMKVCSQSVIKIWNSPNGCFPQSLKSYAVINECLENVGKIDVHEQAACYEIFTAKLRVRINKAPFSFQIFDKYQKLVYSDFMSKGRKVEGSRKIEYKTLRRDEHIFGLGEKTGKLDRRGESYKMWNSDRPCYSTVEDPLYKSIPFFMSNYHYGIFLDNTFKTEFKFGTESREYYNFEVPDGEMLYYFIYGKDYKDIMGQYVGLTGRPIMPPRWALGFAQSRGLLTNEKLTREIADGYRKRGIPCDIIYQDIGWTKYLQDFDWNNYYENPRNMLADLDKIGFKVIVSQDPVVAQANKKQWAEANLLGYFVKDTRNDSTYNMPWPWGGDCGVVDFTIPEVSDWWGEYQQKAINDGVRGFWTDMGEPAWSNEDQPERLFMKHHDGMHDKIHNVYGLTWDRVVKEQFEKRNPNKRVFQMTRSAYAGLQRYTFGWSGDSGNGDDVTQGWSQMANQIPVLLSAGLGLIPFNTCDISGYCGDIENYPEFAELYTRWVQMGAFTALSRIHHEGNNAVEPWLFGNEAEAAVKKVIELKYSLLPYIYTYAREAYDKGLPIMRPMFMEYPMDQETFSTDAQFMFGKELLVAPVVKKNARSKNVYLPEGKWINYNDKHTSYSGESWVTVDAPLDQVPVFVRQGSIIPKMPVMNYTNERPDCPITFEVFPAADSESVSFTLYEDNGEDLGYQREEWAKTPISCATSASGFTVSIASRLGKGYSVPDRNMYIEIYMTREPKAITINGMKLKKVKTDKLDLSTANGAWSWDRIANKCTIIRHDTGIKADYQIINTK